MSDEREPRERLRATLGQRLSLEEVREAAFDLGFSDYEGLTRRQLIIDLMEFLHQRGRLGELVDWLGRNRVDIELAFWQASTPEQAPRSGTPGAALVADNPPQPPDARHGRRLLWTVGLGGLILLMALLVALLNGLGPFAPRDPSVITRVTVAPATSVSLVTPRAVSGSSSAGATPTSLRLTPAVVRPPVATGAGALVLNAATAIPVSFCTESDFDRRAGACRISHTTFPAGTDVLYASWTYTLPEGTPYTIRWYRDDALVNTVEREAGRIQFTSLTPIFVRPGSKVFPASRYRFELVLQGSATPVLAGSFTVQ